MQHMIVLKNARLGGVPVGPGDEVELVPALAAAWAKRGLALYKSGARAPEQKKEETPAKTELDGLSRGKLLALARERGLEISGNPSKAELVLLIEDDELEKAMRAAEGDLEKVSQEMLLVLAEKVGVAIPGESTKTEIIQLLEEEKARREEEAKDEETETEGSKENAESGAETPADPQGDQETA